MATKNSRQPFNSVTVSYTNALRALPSILRYYLPHENRPQSGEGDEEQQSISNVTTTGAFQQLPDIGQPPRNFASISLLAKNELVA